MISRLGAAAAAFAALWLAGSAANAVVRGEGRGSVFVTAVVLLAVVAIALGALAIRLARRR